LNIKRIQSLKALQIGT